MCEFTNAKEAYSKLRKEQAELIVSYLRKKVDSETCIVKDSDIFHQNPNDDNQIELAGKLEFHWIKVPKGKGGFIISLQAYDQDPNSGNYHWLLDRIGIYKYDEDTVGCVDTKGTTAINLPMDDEKFGRLTGIINSADENFDKALRVSSPFDNARIRYERAREDERKRIVDCLKTDDYLRINSRQANPGYGGRSIEPITPPYDLRNWKYIQAYKNEKYYFISLQSFYNHCFTDDTGKAQFPAAFDTIGVFCCEENLMKNKSKMVFNKTIREKMKPTVITLPLPPEKGELMEILQDQ